MASKAIMNADYQIDLILSDDQYQGFPYRIQNIDFKAIILITMPSQLFSMGISSFDMFSIYEFEGN